VADRSAISPFLGGQGASAPLLAESSDRLPTASATFFWFGRHTASAPITSGTHTGGSAVIGKPGSAQLEGTA